MQPRTLTLLDLFLVILLAACQPGVSKITIVNPTVLPNDMTLNPTLTETAIHIASPEPSLTSNPLKTSLPAAFFLNPAYWQQWPVIPSVPEFTRQVYLVGQSLGNDRHAFAVFGDCNSEPDVFLGIYETDPQVLAALPVNLQETITWFKGSFNRMSPTVRAGTTTGALLWAQWHQNEYTCTIYETPLQCELRIHKPSFVIIHVGSHYEDRNEGYMRTILDQLITAGVVPILATKADDIDTDEHINAQYARLAVEYKIPFWNFWAAVDDLPKRGLYSRPEDFYQGGLYLTEEAIAIHRLTALQALDVVRRAVMGP
jgi:hypothetical protein